MASLKDPSTTLGMTVLVFVAVMLLGCGPDPEERYDVGYDDGYATGYNTTCKIRATLIEGDWKNEDYKKGYDAGYSAGSAECIYRSD